MLRTRVIPVVLIDGYSVVKTIQFGVRRNQGNPITVARIYNTRNVDELILLDIDASEQGRSIDLFTIEDIASECFMPLTIGGGLRSVEDIRAVLEKGADKVVLNTAALENPELVRESSHYFGAQCIVGSVDIKKENDRYYVFSKGQVIDRDPFEWIRKLQDLGAGEIFVNSVDLDGTMTHCDLELISKAVEVSRVPVIYAGGVASPSDFVAPIQKGVSAVAAASIFHFTRWTPDFCKQELQKAGIPVRL
ncbi:MAG: imidazole glycerol phosphate synthase subunit HisF [Pseudobdellovibrionaceae bacterium]